ncbi:MAG: glycoside hydrolase N-terminal domain-containing protein, partial [Lentisphaeria bacterium]
MQNQLTKLSNVSSTHADQESKSQYRIVCSQPAENWETDCLPIGNGRMGAMIYGGIEKECIQF